MSSSNYEQSNLRNGSFKGQTLRNASFRGADVRGVNFANAILTGANFSHARTGLAPSRSIGLIVSSLVLVAIAGLVIGYSSAFPALVVPLPKGQRKIAFNRQMLTAPLLRISDYSLPFT